MTERYYHGLRAGVDPATPFRGPEVFLALDRELADAYAEDSGVVLACEYVGSHLLTLDTPLAFVAAWTASGADAVEGAFHPYCTGLFAEWARRQGYDAVLIPPSAFEAKTATARSAGGWASPN